MNTTACASCAPGSSASPGMIRAAIASSVAASTALRKCRTGGFGSVADMRFARDRDRLELVDGFGDGPLDGQALRAGGTEEPGDAGDAVEDHLRVRGLGDRAAVAEHDDVRVHGARGVAHRRDAW